VDALPGVKPARVRANVGVTRVEVSGFRSARDAVFEWLEGEQFLIQRARRDHPDFPVLGLLRDGLAMHYYDSRGVHRVYNTSFTTVSGGSGGTSRVLQRFEGTFADGGDTIRCRAQLAHDGATWEDDLESRIGG
jgi:hypothetical protein